MQELSNKKMTPADRLKQFIEYKGITKYEFHKKTGLSNSFIDKAKEIRSDNMRKILNTFPEINPEWLITGKGNMLREAGEPAITKLSHEKVPEPVRENQDIPLYNIQTQAGPDVLFGGGRSVPVSQIRIPNLSKVDGAVYVTGDSMYPILKAGDIVIFKQIHNIPEGFMWGEIYLLDIDMNGDTYVTIKYVQKSDKEGYVKLVSQNEHHADKEIPVRAIRHAAHIKASIRFNTM